MGFDESYEKQQLLQKPVAQAAPVPASPMTLEEDWSTKLCDCFAHPGGPALGWVSLCLPCVQYGILAQQLPKGATHFSGSFGHAAGWFFGLDFLSAIFHCSIWPGVNLVPTSALLHMHMRNHLRTKYNIKGSWFKDFCTAWWCAPCALAQETRELVIRTNKEAAAAGAISGAAPPPPVCMLGNMVMPNPAYGGVHSMPPAGPVAAPVMGAMPPATGFPVPTMPPTQVATITLGKAEQAPAAK